MKDFIIKNNQHKKIQPIFIKIAVAAFWVLVWEIIYRLVGKEILIVSPFHAAQRLSELALQSSFWLAVGSTCLRVISGFLLALIAGAVLAGLSSKFKLVHTVFAPLLEVVKATPVASFIILTLIWITSNRLPVFISFLMVLPLVWANLYTGLQNVSKELLEMAAVFSFSPIKKIRLIYIPSIMPYFIASCTAGLGFAWKSDIAAEIICHPLNSIGKQIYNSRIYLETADLFAWTMAVIILSVLLEKLTVKLLSSFGRRLLKIPKGGRADNA